MSPADDVVPDHLAAEREHLREVLQAAAPMKSDHADHAIRIPIADYLRIVNPRAVLDQLDEVERLRGHRDTSDEMCELQTEMKIRALDEVLALRGALQALVDATKNAPYRKHWVDHETFYAFCDARAAAVAVLAGPGGEL